MTVQAASPSLALSRLGPREAIGWGAAAVVVLAAHLMLGYGALNLREPDPAGSDTPPALVVELAPVAVAPAIQQQASLAEKVLPETVAPVEHLERLAATEPDQAVEVPLELVKQAVAERAEPVADPSSVAPDNVPETIQPERAAEAEPVDAERVEAERVEAEPVEAKQEPLDEVVPDIVETVAPEVLVPLPEPRPVEKESAPKKIVQKAAPRKATPQRAEPRKQKTVQRSKPAASAATEAKPAPNGAEGVSTPRISPATWKARVQSRLNRALRYPRAAEAQRVGGKALVSFAVDASGRVTSSRIARSSGSAELDRAALAMVQRASPLPAPPPELAGSSITVPAVFKPK